MAISRLQQSRQMRRGGGIMGSNAGSMLVAPTADGSRPGYYGAAEDHGQEARSKEKGFDQSDTSNPYSNASQNKQAAENKAIANRHKERVEKIARHDYGPKKNIFQKIAARSEEHTSELQSH